MIVKKATKLFGFNLAVLFAIMLLPSCGVKDGPPSDYGRDWKEIQDAVPTDEPPSKYGNPASYEVLGGRYYVLESNKGFSQKGIASWYGSKFHGQRTSSGETYNMYDMTAAHKTLKIPTYVEVTNNSNGRKAIVKVNDRGPFHEGRIIDLSYAAATKLGVAATGTAPVTIRVIAPDSDNTGPVDENHERQDISTINPAYTFDGGNVYVQVAAFTSEESALKLLDTLRDEKFSSVRIHVEKNKTGMLYRVRVGPVPTTDVAEKLLTQLKEIKYSNAKIVTYN